MLELHHGRAGLLSQGDKRSVCLIQDESAGGSIDRFKASHVA